MSFDKLINVNKNHIKMHLIGISNEIDGPEKEYPPEALVPLSNE